MKIGAFQKCKVHSSSLKGFRITACQSWWNLHKWPLLDAGILNCYCYTAVSSSNSKCPRQAVVTCKLHQLWQAVILKPFKLEECILHFWKPPIFINLVVAAQGYSYILNTLKSFPKMDRFIIVCVVAGYISIWPSVPTKWVLSSNHWCNLGLAKHCSLPPQFEVLKGS